MIFSSLTKTFISYAVFLSFDILYIEQYIITKSVYCFVKSVYFVCENICCYKWDNKVIIKMMGGGQKL